MREWTALPEPTHQTFISHSQGFAQAWTCHAVAPAHYRNRIIGKEVEIELIVDLRRIGMDMYNIEPAVLCPGQRLQIVGPSKAFILVWRKISVGRAHAREKYTARTCVNSRLYQATQVGGNRAQTLLKGGRIL